VHNRLRIAIFDDFQPPDLPGELCAELQEFGDVVHIALMIGAFFLDRSHRVAEHLVAVPEMLLETRSYPLDAAFQWVRFPPGGAVIVHKTEMGMIGIYVKY
jgi:hypothetical protein